ncbi:esterase family protein [Amycolatopsis sp. Poz14]|uniref:alpha/beta hydrolase n=1 Tax=Amycolatopsis sp. Poz14 TaxID=1447705 RepID=UPI001EE7DC76|nr:alpha/beta hydrolase-fold protein [Amycolatopsis sp. Poz14]MCG3752605.1 esterase [Amycolatopsis sp. Poz14]
MGFPVPEEVAGHARAAGTLESPWVWLGFAALAVACAVAAILMRRRRSARRSGTALAVLFALLAAAAFANARVGYVRSGTDLALLLQRTGHLRDLGMTDDDSPASGPCGPLAERLTVADPGDGVPAGRNFVLLPPGYDDPANQHRRYPAVYLIHGDPGGPEDWLTAGDAPGTLEQFSRLRALPPMIVVSVDLTAGRPGFSGEGLDLPRGPKLESYLVRSVLPAVDARYRTLPDRGQRALGGMSSGAFAALNIGLHHVDAFGALLLAMPYDTPGNQQALRAANTPRDYLRAMPFPRPVSVILSAGSRSPGDVGMARRIAEGFRARGQRAVVRLEDGFGHTWRTARASLPYLLAFAAGVFASAPPR